jgi:hypothetical protein
VRDDFAAAARRVAKIGLEGIEIHGAHGHLLQQFPRPSLITVISRVRFLIVSSKIMSQPNFQSERRALALLGGPRCNQENRRFDSNGTRVDSNAAVKQPVNISVFCCRDSDPIRNDINADKCSAFFDAMVSSDSVSATWLALRWRNSNHSRYLPLNRGLRLCRNASTPSLWSSLVLASANWSTSM